MAAFLLTLQCSEELVTFSTFSSLDLRGAVSIAPFWRTRPVGTAPAWSCWVQEPLSQYFAEKGTEGSIKNLFSLCCALGADTNLGKSFMKQGWTSISTHLRLPASPNLAHVPSQQEKNLRNSLLFLLFYIFLIWIPFVKDFTFLGKTLWSFFFFFTPWSPAYNNLCARHHIYRN